MSGKKVYFCGSIRAGRGDADLYHKIIQKLTSCGVEVLTEFVGWDCSKMKNQNEERGLRDDRDIHNQDVQFLSQADAVVAEVTQPSLGVGYELGRAVAMNKKILCLYRPQPDKRLSAMIRGAEDGDRFVVRDYKIEEIDDIISRFVSSLT
ncbi:5-hydroxymethyl-dUMP N-hydrolase-like [Watersipora subatra]|uniref:5-hydroxymethyl-dUMP N-hydrolase-like n=1 Tax=Watersipora subatra TaxID=2589382 RepID=UPI00355BC451